MFCYANIYGWEIPPDEIYFDFGFSHEVSVFTFDMGALWYLNDNLSFSTGFSEYFFDKEEFDFVEKLSANYAGLHAGIETRFDWPFSPYLGLNAFIGFLIPEGGELEENYSGDEEGEVFFFILFLLLIIAPEDRIGMVYPEVGIRVGIGKDAATSNPSYLVFSYKPYYSSKGRDNDFSVITAGLSFVF